eukprot:1139412-Pelagomonas_calceolata.AAC.1
MQQASDEEWTEDGEELEEEVDEGEEEGASISFAVWDEQPIKETCSRKPAILMAVLQHWHGNPIKHKQGEGVAAQQGEGEEEEEEEEEEEDQDVATPWTGLAKLPVCAAEGLDRTHDVPHQANGYSSLPTIIKFVNPKVHGALLLSFQYFQERSDVLGCLRELKDVGFKQLNVLLLGEE